MKEKFPVGKWRTLFEDDFWLLLLACVALLMLLMASAPRAVHAQDSGETDGNVSASQQSAVDANSPDVIGGEDADPGEWPWQAALVLSYYEDAFTGQFCAGTLIAPKWVLTAAHCVSGISPGSIDVVLGRTDLATEEGERIAVAKIMVHADYESGSYYYPNLDNDVALIRLAEPSAQAPLALYNPADEANEQIFLNATVTGWGYVSYDGYGGTRTQVLQELTLPLVSHETCNDFVAYSGAVTENMLCAGYQKGSKGACKGDSGGPLVVYDGNTAEWLQVGIVSWGEGCAEANKYDVYTRVAMYSKWALACVEDVHAPACTGGDSYEPNNDANEATALEMNEKQDHNLHQISDVDWFSFEAVAGQTYVIETFPALSEEDDPLGVERELMDTFLWLYGQNGLSAISHNDDKDTGLGSRVVWTAGQSGQYYAVVNSVNELFEEDRRYAISISETNVSYLPLVQHNVPVE